MIHTHSGSGDLEQGSGKYSPIIIENEVSERAVSQSFAQKFALYGVTREQVEAILLAQGSKCASCGIDATVMEHSLCIDHCHDTLEIRGLLCDGCNTAAGWLEDDPNKAEQLATYLRKNGTGVYTNMQSKHIGQ